jgi:Ca2+-binding EF-hand superfamily protein
MALKLKLGERTGTAEVNPRFGLSSFDIAHESALHFSPDQTMYLTIVALESEDKKIRVNFIVDEQFPDTTTVTSKDLDRLLANASKVVYNVIVKDVRDELCEDLTDEERNLILDRFKEFDSDSDGKISHNEIRQYYEQKKEKQCDGFKKIREMMLTCDSSKKQDIDQKYEARVKNAEKVCEQEIRYFLNLDVDNSGIIDQDEFFRHEARQIAVLRKGQN